MKATITVAAEKALITAYNNAAKAVAVGDMSRAETLLKIANYYAAML